MPHRPPQDIYARHLLSSRGYPLWIPEPDRQLLEYERTDGLEIGDVGVVDPEDGCFDVLFNICLPAAHPFHRTFGVPDSFMPIELHDGDIRITPNIEASGCITSTSVTHIESFQEESSGALDYEFNLLPKEGALLVLPEGAERHVLRNETCFLNHAIQYGTDWYRFARERRGWIIRHDSLYLITGFYKARSWSLAAYENNAVASGFPAQFRAAQIGGDVIDIGTAYSWRTARALNRRIGPIEGYGLQNQAVFIRGFKIALRTGFPGMKRVTVKADAPSTRPLHVKSSGFVPGNARMAKHQEKKIGAGISGHAGNASGSAAGKSSSIVQNEDEPDARVEIHRLPEVSPVYHPCDVICVYRPLE